MHGVFDIVGPVMIGPSSSHTAGAVRLGLFAGMLLGESAVRAEINLHGSFAQTYKGHGTNKAILAGILGWKPDDERIRYALEIAKDEGLSYEFHTIQLENAHPNTAVIYLKSANGRFVRVRGASVGGGNILITNINGYEVELKGDYPALIIVHNDRPGVVHQVTKILSSYEMNIAYMRVSRQRRGEEAMMILELDDVPTDEVLEACSAVYEVEKALSIPAVG